jgi:hypothetical protein
MISVRSGMGSFSSVNKRMSLLTELVGFWWRVCALFLDPAIRPCSFPVSSSFPPLAFRIQPFPGTPGNFPTAWRNVSNCVWV